MKMISSMLVLAFSLTIGSAQKKAPDYVTLKETKLEGTAAPGSRVSATLHFKIKDGFHTQSNKPSEEFFIPTELKFENTKGIKIGKITYPKGHDEKVDGLDKPLSVYDKEFKLKVPIAINARATLPATLKGTLKYQACEGAVCFPPQAIDVEIKLAE